jgi:Recombination, repair and ssDNA binding protein UvsY
MNLTELREEWEKDCSIDSSHLDSEALRTANLHQKYLDLLTTYKIKIFKKDKDYLLMKGIRSRYYQGQCTKEELEQFSWSQYQYKTPLKTELERLLETDPVLLDIKDAMSHYKFCFEFCEEIIKSLRDRNFQIKHAIEWIKFQAGA